MRKIFGAGILMMGLLAACTVIGADLAYKVVTDDGTFVVIRQTQTSTVIDTPSGVYGAVVYQVLPDGQYRALGISRAVNSENLDLGQEIGVYSEKDRTLVSTILGEVTGETEPLLKGGKSFNGIDEVVADLTGATPKQVNSEGHLSFPISQQTIFPLPEQAPIRTSDDPKEPPEVEGE